MKRLLSLVILAGLLSLPAAADGLRSLSCGEAWVASDGATVNGAEVVLPRPEAAATQPWPVEPVAERCFRCMVELRADDPQTPFAVVLNLVTDRGQPCEYRLFEYCQSGADWTALTEAVVFPASAARVVGVRLERGPGAGAVAMRNLRLQEQGLRFDHRPRPLIPVPAEWGPSRQVAPATAELLHRPGLAALSPQVHLPIFLAARSGLPPRTMARVHLALPAGAGSPFLVTQGHPESHVGAPEVRGELRIAGQSYREFAMPTMLYSSQNEAQAVLYLKPTCPPGEVIRVGYWVEWDGGRQATRWLEAEVIDLPAGPKFEHWLVAGALPYPWVAPQVPDLAELLHRVGLGAVEIGDIVGDTEFRRRTFDFLRQKGITVIGGFSPGWWYPYQTALAKDPEMQARGSDGQTVPTDHGPAACPSYRGPLYQQQMDVMRVFARFGLEHVSFDEEFFGPGTKICFCERCRKLWDQYRARHSLPADVALERLAREPQEHPALYQAWVQFKADLMTEWYHDYRAALAGELEKTGRAGALHMHATCQTFANGAGEVELRYIMRDNAARLGQGLVQGLLPMPYFYEPYYDGSVRKVGEELVALQKLWGPHAGGKPALFPYLLSGGAGMCLVAPQRGLKYQMYEAFTTGAVSGCILWTMKGMDGYHYRALAEALHALARVEQILAGGQMREIACTPEGAAARAVVRGDQAALMVSHYGYEPVTVIVPWPAERALVVEDAETGRTVATLAAGDRTLPVSIDRERVRLLRLRPR